MEVISMEWIKVFRLYNLRMLKSHTLLYGFVMMSIAIAVSISVSIPQIIRETDRAMKDQVAELNGADLKVVVTYESQAFQQKIKELEQEGLSVKRIEIFSTIFSQGPRQALGYMLTGDYELEPDEIILYSSIAADLHVMEGDTIAIGGYTYTIKAVEPVAMAVDSQSEMVGYGKASAYNSMNSSSLSSIMLINSSQSQTLKQELEHIEPGYKYSTIQDKQTEIADKLSLNAATLNILNTLSYMMTILSVLSSIFIMVVRRQRDIAVIRLLSIRMKSIKKALRTELYMMLLTPALLGGAASMLLAKRLLEVRGIAYSPIHGEALGAVGAGTLLFLFIYAVFINLATMSLEAIHPLAVMRSDAAAWRKSKRKIAWLASGFTLATLVGYALFLGMGSALTSSLLMLVFIALFFGAAMLLIKLGCRFPYRRKLFIYTSRHIRANRYSFVIVILSMALTILVLLMGYTLETTMRDSFNKGTEQRLPYNYLASGSDSDVLEKALKETPDVEGFTKSHVTSGTLTYPAELRRAVQLQEIYEKDYGRPYTVLEGESLFSGAKGDVLVSASFRDGTHLGVGDFLNLEIQGEAKEYRIKGVYESGMINQNDILKPMEDAASTQGRALFLIKAGSTTFRDGMEKVMTIHVGVMGVYLEKMIHDLLTIFKWLCFICIFSSILFNLNLMYMSTTQEWKETVIIRALGLGKGFLIRFTALRAAISLALSLLLSLGLYLLLVKLALALMKIGSSIAIQSMIGPVACAIALTIIIFLLPFRLIRRAKGYTELREQV